VNSNERQRDPEVAASASSISKNQHRKQRYHKVCDERKRPIRGLWVRNGRYYAQLTVEDLHTGQKSVRRVPLEKATTPAQAKAEFDGLLVQRRKGKLPVLKRSPKFAPYADKYLEFHKQAKDKKRASTMETEGYAITRWKDHVGDMNLDKIRRIHVDDYIGKRQQQGASARTVNLEVTVFRNVMNRAIDADLISSLPTENLRPLKVRKRERLLVDTEDVEKLCSAGFNSVFVGDRLAKENEQGRPLLNAQEFSDYVRLMCYSGTRMSEALRLQWEDVRWPNRQLTIGSDGLTKSGKSRVVDFNAKLEAHLQDMLKRRQPNSRWLFPSPRRGKEDRPAKTFRESLILARLAAGKPSFGFHDCRHHFISFCVMSGIDFMTIARWVGHADGGVLIGKVYGHLADAHTRTMAQRVNFEIPE
jgi:integrase